MVESKKALNVFLFFTFLAMMFYMIFPPFFEAGQVVERQVSYGERLLSFGFVVLWIVFSLYCTVKKQWPLWIGGLCYSIVPYISANILDRIASDKGELNLFQNILHFLFGKINEFFYAPLVGVSILLPSPWLKPLGRWMFGFLFLSYALTRLVQFYHKAYLMDQLHLHEYPTARGRNNSSPVSENSMSPPAEDFISTYFHPESVSRVSSTNTSSKNASPKNASPKNTNPKNPSSKPSSRKGTASGNNYPQNTQGRANPNLKRNPANSSQNSTSNSISRGDPLPERTKAVHKTTKAAKSEDEDFHIHRV